MSSPSCGPCACGDAFLEAGWQGQRGQKSGLWGSELNDPQVHAAWLFSPSPPGGAASHRRKGRWGRASQSWREQLVSSLVRAGLGAAGLGTRCESKSWPSSSPSNWTLTCCPGQDGGRVRPRPRRAKPRVPALWGASSIPFYSS